MLKEGLTRFRRTNLLTTEKVCYYYNKVALKRFMAEEVYFFIAIKVRNV